MLVWLMLLLAAIGVLFAVFKLLTGSEKNSWIVEFRLFMVAFIRFFPVQLLLLHIKRSHTFLLFWLVIFGMTGGYFFRGLGIPFLFLTPEYLGVVGSISFFIIGVFLGLFIMAFHIASYIFYSHKFTFLAALSRPLYRFAFNNSIIPLAFFVWYIWHMSITLHSEGWEFAEIFVSALALVAGSILSVSLSFTYFFSTIKPLPLEKLGESLEGPIRALVAQKKTADLPDDDHQRVLTYLKNFVSIRWARDCSHYNKSEMLDTLNKHHVNATLYFILVAIVLFTMGYFADNPWFRIPAGASIILILTFYLMIIGAVYSRFKGWTLPFILVAGLLLNYFSGWPQWQQVHYAFGMNYRDKPAEYSFSKLDSLTSKDELERDRASTLERLELWKSKQSNPKPKLVIINSSGGGLRSALWSLSVLQVMDSLASNQWWDQVFMVTGSSGGMVGTSFFRELKYQGLERNYLANFQAMGSDILNPIGFSMVVNDMFPNFSRVSFAGQSYPRDRGYAFERALSENTREIMRPIFSQYRNDEASCKIPWMIFAPTVISDGRRMMISNLNASYLTINNNPYSPRIDRDIDGIEFMKLFKDQGADSIQFATVLRMSSTFPYITPLVSMPSEPRIEVIDAGARDNDGFLLGLRFVHEFKDWISENTDGVVFIQLLANKPIDYQLKGTPYKTKLDALLKPIGGVVNSFANLQGFAISQNLNYARDWASFPIDVQPITLLDNPEVKISLSWHLTEREKQLIYTSAHSQRVREYIDQAMRISSGRK